MPKLSCRRSIRSKTRFRWTFLMKTQIYPKRIVINMIRYQFPVSAPGAKPSNARRVRTIPPCEKTSLIKFQFFQRAASSKHSCRLWPTPMPSRRQLRGSGRIRQSDGPSFWNDRVISANASEERTALRAAAREGASLESHYEKALTVITGDFGMRDFSPLSPAALPQRCDLLIAHQPEINEMLALRRQREVLAQAGLSDFLVSADKVFLEAGRLQRVFETFVSERRADRIRRTTPALNANGTTLEARRKLFAERDRRKIDVDRRDVKDKLLRVTPAPGCNHGPRKTWTDTALLRNEFAKQGRFTPVRNLLSRAGQAIQTLTPCFMMSPLSLAKFLTPGNLAFDLIVIDEASQMQPEDALGGCCGPSRSSWSAIPSNCRRPISLPARTKEHPPTMTSKISMTRNSILEACTKGVSANSGVSNGITVAAAKA